MYEFLSNTKGENNSWSVNSSKRASSISSSTSYGPSSWFSQINVSLQILKQCLTETGRGDCIVRSAPLSAILSLKWNEVAGIMFYTLCWRSLSFLTFEKYCKSSQQGPMKLNLERKGTPALMWQNETPCVSEAFPAPAQSRATLRHEQLQLCT